MRVAYGATPLGLQVFAEVSQPFSASPSSSQKPGLQWMTRHVPPMQPVSVFGMVQSVPQMPQFFGSSARVASQPLPWSRSQSAVPGAQSLRRPAAAGSSGSGSAVSFATLSAETVTGMRGSQFPKPKMKHAPSTNDDVATIFATQFEHRARRKNWVDRGRKFFADPFAAERV